MSEQQAMEMIFQLQEKLRAAEAENTPIKDALRRIRYIEERAAQAERALRDLLGIIDSEPRMSGFEVLTFCGSPAHRTRVMQQARAALQEAAQQGRAPGEDT